MPASLPRPAPRQTPGAHPVQAVVRDAEDWWRRTARSPARLALVFLTAGFALVFLHQGDELAQLVFGAPIFEEALKFGTALLLTSAARLSHPALRIGVAWAVGAGFGWLEHVVSYPEDDFVVFWGRLAFHAASTGLSMVAYVVASLVGDPRSRWVSTLPASLLHYAHNTGQLWLGLGVRPLGVSAQMHDELGRWVGLGAILGCVASQAVVWIAQNPYRRMATRLAGGVLGRL